MSIKSRIGRLERLLAEKAIAAKSDDDFDLVAYLVNIAVMDAIDSGWSGRRQSVADLARGMQLAEESQRIVTLICRSGGDAIDAAVALALAPHGLPGGAAEYAELLRSTPSDRDHAAVLTALESPEPTQALYGLIADRIGERIDVARPAAANE